MRRIDKRSTLRQGQIDILRILYKYRFSSRQLLADSLHIAAGSNLYEKLNVLMRHKLVARRYNARLKLQGIPAAYYLIPKGFKTLQTIDSRQCITDRTIRSSYRDKIVGQAFINHTLAVHKYTNTLTHKHPTLRTFLRRDMSRYDYFPNNPPDAFLSLKIGEEATPRRFFFDFISETTPRTAINHRIAQYIKFFDEGGWNETNSELPKLLFLVETIAIKKRLLKAARAIRNQFDMEDDIEVYITTANDIEHADASRIWISIDDPDSTLSLDDL